MFVPAGFHWCEFGGSGSLSSAFGFVVIIIFIFPLVLVVMIEEVGRSGERPATGVRDIAELELCLIDDSRSRLNISPFWRQKLLELLKTPV